MNRLARGAVPVLLARLEDDAVAGRITSIGPPRRCDRPTPSKTQIVWPFGWCARRCARLG